MFSLFIDADSMIYAACGITEKVVYDILPKDFEIDAGGHEPKEYDEYKHMIIQSFRYVKDYTNWLKENKKEKEDFLRVDRKESAPIAHTLKIIDDMIQGVIDRFKPEQTIVYLSGDNNFREVVATVKGYKENRKDRKKPKQFQECYDHIKTKWKAVVAKGEADDYVATAQMSSLRDGEYSVIATNDKDLKMIPGWHYNYMKKELNWITPDEAIRWFYYQLLVGDVGDNVPGCPDVGKKTAPKILEKCKTEYDMYKACLKEYNRAYGNGKKGSLTVAKAMLIEQARLLWMQRNRDEMWFPPENSTTQ